MLQLAKAGQLLIVLLAFTISVGSAAETSAPVLAARLAARIGTYVPPATVNQMTTLIQSAQNGTNSNGFVQAAALVTSTAGYGDTFLFNLMAPMCSLLASANVTQNPCIATLQFIAWNNMPWTDALEGQYVGVFVTPTPAPTVPLTSPLPAPSLAMWNPAITSLTTPIDNWTAAYTEFQQGKLSYVQYLKSVPQQTLYDQVSTGALTGTDGTYNVTATVLPQKEFAGILTLPQVAYDTAYMGTNRRFVEFLFQNMLASPLQAIRDASFGTSAAVDGIRKDVQGLAPDTVTFTTTCATCHGGIDRMAAAFNLMDYTSVNNSSDQLLTQSSNGLVQKLAARETEYAKFPGYVESYNSPAINSWTINYKNSPYGTYAWGSTTGTGIAQLAAAAAATDEFRINLINNIWTLACGQAPTTANVPVVVSMAKAMRLMYADNVTAMVQQVATLPQCLGR